MKFVLLDRIVEVEPGRRIVAVKSLTLAEEYLGDHFPAFPVMPGVLMLEALVQSATWLVHVTEGFRHGLVTLDEVKSATYKSFLKPGDQLRLEIAAKRIEASSSEFVGVGLRENTEVLRCRMSLRHANLADTDPRHAGLDARLIADARQRWALLGGAALVESMSAAPVECGQ